MLLTFEVLDLFAADAGSTLMLYYRHRAIFISVRVSWSLLWVRCGQVACGCVCLCAFFTLKTPTPFFDMVDSTTRLELFRFGPDYFQIFFFVQDSGTRIVGPLFILLVVSRQVILSLPQNERPSYHIDHE